MFVTTAFAGPRSGVGSSPSSALMVRDGAGPPPFEPEGWRAAGAGAGGAAADGAAGAGAAVAVMVRGV